MLPESETVAQAIRTRELSVVVDPFLTDTARLATVVLPTTTLLEDDDLVGAYGHHYLGEVAPGGAAARRGEDRPRDPAGAGGAAGRGMSEVLAGSAREWKARLIAGNAGPARHRHRRLRRAGR